jgi:hypothetical protein
VALIITLLPGTFVVREIIVDLVSMTDADFVQLVSGKATAKSLYQHGKLRVDGDVSVAHRLGFLKGLV